MTDHGLTNGEGPSADADADAEILARPASRRRTRGKAVLRVGLLVVAISFAALALRSQWGDVRAKAHDLSLGHVSAAALFAVASLWTSFLAWRATLEGLGDVVSVRKGARVFFVSQLGKYVPGSVWAIVGQMEIGRAYGLRRNRLAAAGVLVLAISLTVALVLGVLAVPATVSSGSGAYAALVLLAIPLAVVLHPRVLAALLDRGMRLLRRPALEQPLTGRTIAKVAALSVLSNGLLGLEVWQLSQDLGGHGASLVFLCIGAYALAAAAGVIAIPLPAGAGLREAILVLLLAPSIGTASATLVAIMARLVATTADLAVAGAVALAVRGPKVSPPPR